jgi:uncharacterized protein YbaR (Trm112 family)
MAPFTLPACSSERLCRKRNRLQQLRRARLRPRGVCMARAETSNNIGVMKTLRGLWHSRPAVARPLKLTIVPNAVDKALLDILVCPAARNRCGWSTRAGLKCDACRRVYPIKDDIPVMLIDEATTRRLTPS